MRQKQPVGFTIAGIVAGLILLVVIIKGYSRRASREDTAREQSELQRLSDSADNARRNLLYGATDSAARRGQNKNSFLKDTTNLKLIHTK